VVPNERCRGPTTAIGCRNESAVHTLNKGIPVLGLVANTTVLEAEHDIQAAAKTIQSIIQISEVLHISVPVLAARSV
jgi:hypothetical protein